ncbi:hypothetical protein BURKHO8Y_580083 [Burkholderia sp. 8Y]|nr:hypothetical protein BURKHO8Y_580083 [Burkholderia sp. 8Y]
MYRYINRYSTQRLDLATGDCLYHTALNVGRLFVDDLRSHASKPTSAPPLTDV